jgi:hypothetical protein
MPGSGKLKKQLLKMWNENPHCHWCGRMTTLEGRDENKLNPETATLDHLYSRLDPRRKEVNRTMEKRRLLACYECNQRRCHEEITASNTEKERRRILSALGIQTTFE